MRRPCTVKRSTAEQGQLAGDGAQQRRFARAVGSEQTDALPGQDRPVDAGHDRLARVAERGMVELNELPRMNFGRRQNERKRAVDVRGCDQFHALERLDPALRLLGLGRLGAETVDVRAQVRDLPLLLGVRGLLLRQRQRVLAFELAVVACVKAQLVRVQMGDRRHDRVEKIAVVRDQRAACPGIAAATPRARARRRGRGGWSARRAATGRSASSAPAPG